MTDDDHKESVNAVYKKILFREADSYGLQHYVTLLKKRKITIQDIENELLNSEEAKKKQLDAYYKEGLQTLYKKILLRDADNDGLQYYHSLLREEKITMEGIENELLNSEEAKKKQLDAYYKEGLQTLYKKILLRDVDDEGLEHYVLLLKENKITLEDVEKELSETEEAKKNVLHEKYKEILRVHFQKVLARPPDEETMEGFITMIGRDGLSIGDVKKLISTSSETKSQKFLKYAPNFKTSLPELELKNLLQSVDWYHYFKFGDVETPSSRTPLNYQMLIAQGIPVDLSGKSVLDIGANNGFYSFLCESRGAKRVLAMDSEEYNAITKEYGDNKGFEACKKILNSSVEYRKMSVLDLDKLNEIFDIVLFFGVYYHLEDVVLTMRKIFSHVNETLFLSGHIINSPEPVLCYYDEYEMDSRDNSNWWAASPSCLINIGHRIGFRSCELLDTIDVIHPHTSDKTKNTIRELNKIGLFKFSR